MEHYVNIHAHRVRAGELSPRESGIHPWSAESWSQEQGLVIDAEAQVVGETGLDFACRVSLEQQERLFRAHLQIAQERQLPVVIHCVRAFEEVMKILSEYSLRGVIFHGFVGSWQQAERVVARSDYYISFGERSMRSPRSVDALRRVPLERLFLESDDAPAPIDGLYGDVAVVRGLSIESLMQVTFDNYKKLFNI